MPLPVKSLNLGDGPLVLFPYAVEQVTVGRIDQPLDVS